MPRGGRRAGAGRKPKTPHLRAIDGGAGKRGLAPMTASATAPVEILEPPATVTGAVLVVWQDLAPAAIVERTLTAATLTAFAMLCRNVVLERKLGSSHTKGNAAHRGMIQRVQADLSAFNLRPCGKALYQPDAQPAANPLTRFTQRRA